MRTRNQARSDGRTATGRFAKGVSGNPSGLPKNRVANDEIGELAQRADSWMSSQTGIGMPGYDKRLSHYFTPDVITYRTAMSLWEGDDLAARAIETIPQECFRRGYEVNIPDAAYADLRKKVLKLLVELGVDEKIERAYKLERAFGGGALLLGINDGQEFDQPVDLQRVTSLDYVTVLEPVEVTPLYYYEDPGRLGQPSHYQLNIVARGPQGPQAVKEERQLPKSRLIHESRLITFDGIKVSAYQASSSMAGGNWGHSVLTRFAGVLRDFNVAWQSAGIVVVDFSQSVFTMDNLVQLMASNKQAQIAERLRMIELARSTARAVLIDKNESYTRQTTSLSGLPDLLDRLSKRLAAAIDMPLSLLMGIDAVGGSEGEAGIRFFYDRVASIQTRRIKPILERIIRLLMWSIGKEEPEEWTIKFHPLWQPTDKEKAESRATQANTDNMYVLMGALTPEEVRKARFSGEYSFETQIDTSNEEQEAIAGAPAAQDPAALAAMGRDPATGAPAPGAEVQNGGHPGVGAPAAPGVEGAPPMLPNGKPAVEAAKVALNGAQVTSLLEIVRAANQGEISRDGAVPLIVAAYPTVTEEQAQAMLGPSTFKSKVVEPAGRAPAPAVPAEEKVDWDPDQERAEDGKWTSGGGGGGARGADKSSKGGGEVKHSSKKPGGGLAEIAARARGFEDVDKRYQIAQPTSSSLASGLERRRQIEEVEARLTGAGARANEIRVATPRAEGRGDIVARLEASGIKRATAERTADEIVRLREREDRPVRVNAPRGPGLSEVGDENGTTAPQAGKPFAVFRLGSAGDGLENRNAGNAEAVARHLARAESDDGSAPAGGFGDTITMHVVEADGFGKYTAMNRGVARATSTQVGREAADFKGNATSNITYSFPKGGDWKAREVVSFSASEARSFVEKVSGGKYSGFDDLGGVLGGEYLREFARVKLAARGDAEDELHRLMTRRDERVLYREALAAIRDLAEERGVLAERRDAVLEVHDLLLARERLVARRDALIDMRKELA